MKKWIGSIAVVIMLGSIGVTFFLQRPDYRNMDIIKIRENHIVITPPARDPEAEYPVYKIMIKSSTVIIGSEDIKGLKIGDTIDVWIEAIEDQEVAARIIKNE
ncbi:hypothetical protein IMZ31_11180 [Pontibacillus sp. ALD_SL1]|uniref:hypothetical protein n=1 Tax=Pontibacillus sp. ALD_SL1 TaxID=2777185 RepID=UPI001A979884|nr:hypothetical protein [Pontibacillus sp. ALD_SL1]QSS98672.1 hypothetical protein IMZ31_11180 [Pontibacillus sp. ALD_SL1]